MRHKFPRLLLPLSMGLVLAALVCMAGEWRMQDAGAATPDGPQDEQGPLPAPERKPPEGLPIDSALYQADLDYKAAILDGKLPLDQVQANLAQRGLLVNELGKVRVVIEGQPGGPAVPPEIILQVGGEIIRRLDHLTSAWVPFDQLINLAQLLPEGFLLRRPLLPEPDETIGEGPQVMNSDDYRDGTSDCNGMTIGAIDNQYSQLTSATTSGDWPTSGNRTLVNLAGGTFESGGTHGTNVVEQLFDHCPGADYVIYKVVDELDVGQAIDDATITKTVDVMAMSMSWYNTGWADDTGIVCQKLNTAASKSFLFFNSSGNRAESHWQGDFTTTDGDAWHEFSGADERLGITIQNGRSFTAWLSWDTGAGVNDYDLFLYNTNVTRVLTSSEAGGTTFEEVSWVNNTGVVTTTQLLIKRYSGGVAEMELFGSNGGTWEANRAIAANSTTSPSNCTKLKTLSVGAVDWNDYGSVGNVLQSYSSQGPTNSGHQAPDIVGPTNTHVTIDPPTFGGTSCATPNAAGAAAAFWAANQLNSETVRYLIQEQAGIFRDWGTAGTDSEYGRGGVYLVDFMANSVWVDRRGVPSDCCGIVFNTTGISGWPYMYVNHAEADATAGGRVVFLGQTYPEAVTLSKNLLYISIGWNAYLGATSLDASSPAHSTGRKELPAGPLVSGLGLSLVAIMAGYNQKEKSILRRLR